MPSEYLEDISNRAESAGLCFLWHRDSEGYESVTLLDRDHRPLYHWPYVPSLTEAREKAHEFINEGVIK